jgi:hypothetical protein
LRGKEDIQFTPGLGLVSRVNTQIHPATFGGIANGNYIRNFIYAQGFFALISVPFPDKECADSITFLYFRNPKQANGVLIVRIDKLKTLEAG